MSSQTRRFRQQQRQSAHVGNLAFARGVYSKQVVNLLFELETEVMYAVLSSDWGEESYNLGCAVRVTAGAATLGELASAIATRDLEAAIVAELKAGSEDAYAWLIGEFHQPIYSLVYRILTDPADAADTTQEVFLKVFRGIRHFNSQSSLKTWIYRIAVHEASNRRRWWFRHKARETSMELEASSADGSGLTAREALVDDRESPFDNACHQEVRARVEAELRQVPEPYRSTVILRDLEDMSYEEIAEVLDVSLGTVKSRLTRGRDALRRRLTGYVQSVGDELGLQRPQELEESESRSRCRLAEAGKGLEVTS